MDPFARSTNTNTDTKLLFIFTPRNVVMESTLDSARNLQWTLLTFHQQHSEKRWTKDLETYSVFQQERKSSLISHLPDFPQNSRGAGKFFSWLAAPVLSLLIDEVHWRICKCWADPFESNCATFTPWYESTEDMNWSFVRLISCTAHKTSPRAWHLHSRGRCATGAVAQTHSETTPQGP